MKVFRSEALHVEEKRLPTGKDDSFIAAQQLDALLDRVEQVGGVAALLLHFPVQAMHDADTIHQNVMGRRVLLHQQLVVLAPIQGMLQPLQSIDCQLFGWSG